MRVVSNFLGALRACTSFRDATEDYGIMLPALAGSLSSEHESFLFDGYLMRQNIYGMIAILGFGLTVHLSVSDSLTTVRIGSKKKSMSGRRSVIISAFKLIPT